MACEVVRHAPILSAFRRQRDAEVHVHRDRTGQQASALFRQILDRQTTAPTQGHHGIVPATPTLSATPLPRRPDCAVDSRRSWKTCSCFHPSKSFPLAQRLGLLRPAQSRAQQVEINLCVTGQREITPRAGSPGTRRRLSEQPATVSRRRRPASLEVTLDLLGGKPRHVGGHQRGDGVGMPQVCGEPCVNTSVSPAGKIFTSLRATVSTSDSSSEYCLTVVRLAQASRVAHGVQQRVRARHPQRPLVLRHEPFVHQMPHPDVKPNPDSIRFAHPTRPVTTCDPAGSTAPAPVVNSWAERHPASATVDGSADPPTASGPPARPPHESTAARSNPRNSSLAPGNAAPALRTATAQSTDRAASRHAPPTAPPRAPTAQV